MRSYKSTSFHNAAHAGHVDVINELCSSGLYPLCTFPSWDDRTALDVALERNHERVAQILINCGRKHSSASTYGTTLTKALHTAAAKGLLAAARTLLDNGASIDALTEHMRDKSSPLEVASLFNHLPILQLLLERGAKLVISEDIGCRALNLAISRGYDQAVRLLLDHMQKTNHQGGKIACQIGLLVAVKDKQLKIIESLLSKDIDIDWKGPGAGETALHRAVATRSTEIVKMLVKHNADLAVEDRFKFIPSRRAMQLRDKNMLALLLELGADPNYQHMKDVSLLSEAIQMNDLELAQVLIDHGADVETTNTRGARMMHVAAEMNDTVVLEFLLQNGANINAHTSKSAFTPLMAAARTSSLSALHVLLNRGADHAIQEDDGNLTALHFATSFCPIEGVALLLAYGATQKSSRTGFPIDVARRMNKIEVADLLHEYGTIEPPPFQPCSDLFWRMGCDPTTCPPVFEVPLKDACPLHPDVGASVAPSAPATSNSYPYATRPHGSVPSSHSFPNIQTEPVPELGTMSSTPAWLMPANALSTHSRGTSRTPSPLPGRYPLFNQQRDLPLRTSTSQLYAHRTEPPDFPRSRSSQSSLAPKFVQLTQVQHDPTTTSMPATVLDSYPTVYNASTYYTLSQRPVPQQIEPHSSLPSNHFSHMLERCHDWENPLDDASVSAQWDSEDEDRSLPEVEEHDSVDGYFSAAQMRASNERQGRLSHWLQSSES